MEANEMGRRGGASRSPRKQAASRENLKKARAARLAGVAARKNADSASSSLTTGATDGIADRA